MFSNNAYVKVWEVQEKTKANGKTRKTVRVSSSRKNDDGTYTQDFNGFVELVGNARNKEVKDNDRIQFISVGVTNNYDKEKNITYTNYLCFDFRTQAELDAARAASGQVPVDEQPSMPTTSGEPTEAPASAPASTSEPAVPDIGDGFMNIPDGIDDELPFN